MRRAGTGNGLSIVIDCFGKRRPIRLLLDSLARHNTLAPLEVILLNAPGPEDRLPGGDSEEIPLSIRNVPAGGRQSPAGAANDAAGTALYPTLLFLAAEVVFTRDILPLALAQLDDPEIGVVGMRLDDYPPSLPFFETPGVRHLGVRFFHDPAAMLYRPRVVKLANRDEAWDIPSGLYPAVGEGFFLCRRTDFATLHGFSLDYGKGYEYLDFCLRMSGQLGRKILCINEPGLEISRGSVDSPAFSGSGSQPDRNLHLLNERAGDQLGEPGTFLEPSSGFPIPEEEAAAEAVINPGTRAGVSLIIRARGGSPGLDGFLESFFRFNTYRPVEVIIIETGPAGNAEELASAYQDQAYFLVVNMEGAAPAFSRNSGACNAVYPFLLFADDDIVCTSDFIPGALLRLQEDREVGAVGAGLQTLKPERSREGGAEVYGIRFARRKPSGWVQPEWIDGSTVEHYQYESGAGRETCPQALPGCLMLCRREDFISLHGFSEEYEYGLDDLDFCLRLRRDLGKRCVSLERIPMGLSGMTGAETDGRYFFNGNATLDCRRFNRRWSAYIERLLPPGEVEAAPLSSDAPHVWIRACPGLAGREVCFFAAYEPNGQLAGFKEAYLARLRKAGLFVVLILAVDDIAVQPLESCESADAILLRENRGYDFGSWAAAIDGVPSVWEARLLVLANDSVFGPSASFEKTLGWIRESKADVIGLTESLEHGSHLQSYFLALKGKALGSPELRKRLTGIRSLNEKWHVILEYEVKFTSFCRSLGLECRALFPYDEGCRPAPGEIRNPGHFRWKELLAKGCPFVKVELLCRNPEALDLDGWEEVLLANGFDRYLVRQQIPETMSLVQERSLQPINCFTSCRNLRRIEEEGFQWEAQSDDPEFSLDISEFFMREAGWFAVSISVRVPEPGGRAKLIFETSRGIGAERVVAFPFISDRPLVRILKLDDQVLGIRFKPVERCGRFTITRIGIGRLERNQAEERMLGDLILEDRYRNLRGRADLRKVLKSGPGGLPVYRKRLLREYASIFGENHSLSYRRWIQLVEQAAARPPCALPRGGSPGEGFLLVTVVIPIRNTGNEYLREAVASVCRQSYPRWELFLVADFPLEPLLPSIKEAFEEDASRVKVLSGGGGLGFHDLVNQALETASGEYLAFLDQSDVLAEHALLRLVTSVGSHLEGEIFYTDEDRIDRDGVRFDPFFKPGWSPDYFYSRDYVSRLAFFRKNLLIQSGGLRPGPAREAWFELLLRCLSQAGDRVVHVPGVLCHHRCDSPDTSSGPGEEVHDGWNCTGLLEEYLASRSRGKVLVEGGPLPGTRRIRYCLPDPAPLVSLLVPTRDRLDLLEPCISSILEKTTHPRYEVVIIDNQSRERETMLWMDRISRECGRVRILRYDRPYNFSAICNFGVEHADGEIIGLINNDIEVISPGWLEEMAGQAWRTEIGCVGAKLYFGDGTIQHAGVILGLDGIAVHVGYGLPRDFQDGHGRLALVQNYSAVTGAALLVRRGVYLELGGLDEENLAVTFNDVDFCLKALRAGYRNLWTPYAELYHHESRSRGYDSSPEQVRRYKEEAAFMKRKWGRFLLEDPAYNPHLSWRNSDFSLGGLGREDLRSMTESFCHPGRSGTWIGRK